MRVIFNIATLSTKLFLVLIVIILFTIVYITLPINEFKKIKYDDENESKEIGYIDFIYYSLLSHVGFYNAVLYPKTKRAKILTMLQIFIGYSMLLM